MSKRLTIQNPEQEIKQFNHRMITIVILIVILVMILVGRLFYLQIIQHEMFSTLSRQNLLNVAPIDPNRGLIYDRNGVLLAENVPVFSLEISPEHVNNIKQTIADLSQIVSISPTDIQEFYKALRQQRHFTNTVPLKMQLTENEVAQFSVNQYRFPGVSIHAHLLRYYPFGASMSHLLGYVGRINSAELAQVDQTNYSGSNYIGKMGVEKYYETQLHGVVGIQQVETDAGGRVIRETKSTPATPGNNLYLTIDSRLQLAIEKVLGNENGAVVAIDPRNGEILALVSNPGFDPNPFVKGINSNAYQALQKDPNKPLINRAIRGTYPPGSTIKPYMALAGLESGVVTPNFTIFDPGWYKLPGASHIYHDWKKGGHGRVSMENGIIQSCDVYFYTLANKLGINRMHDILAQFGFGLPTGIDTYSELPGVNPSPQWKLKAKDERWYPGDTINAGIGQGFVLFTPLQLAIATSILADRGVHYKPHLVLKSQAPDGEFTYTKPQIISSVKLPASGWDLVLRAMHEVITDPRGTGYRAGLHALYSYAGKSGTAQTYSIKNYSGFKNKNLPTHLRDHSWFEAFAPVDNPHIALAIIVEHNSEHAASYMTREILDDYFYPNGVPNATPPDATTNNQNTQQPANKLKKKKTPVTNINTGNAQTQNIGIN